MAFTPNLRWQLQGSVHRSSCFTTSVVPTSARSLGNPNNQTTKKAAAKLLQNWYQMERLTTIVVIVSLSHLLA